MAEVYLNNIDSKECRWQAAANADARNKEMIQYYDEKQISHAKAISNMLDLAYDYTAKYVNYRKKFIAVKLAGAKVKNRAVKETLDTMLDYQGITKAITKQGMIVRIKRQQ